MLLSSCTGTGVGLDLGRSRVPGRLGLGEAVGFLSVLVLGREFGGGDAWDPIWPIERVDEPPSNEVRLADCRRFLEDLLVTNFVEAEKFGDKVETRMDFMDRPTFSENEAFIGAPVKAAGSPGGAVQIKLRWAFRRALPLVRNC